MAKRKIEKAVQNVKQPTTENTKPSVAPFTEIGITGVTRYGGTSRVYEEFLRELQGPAGMKLYREQKDNCPISGAFLFAAQHLSRRTTFRLDPANDSQAARYYAERIRGAIFDDMSTTWPDLLSEILSMLPFGWAVFEMVFKRCLGYEAPPTFDSSGRPLPDKSPFLPPPGPIAGPFGQGPAQNLTFTSSRYDDGLIGFKKLSLRAQETLFMWEWDNESSPLVLQQMAPPDYQIRRIPLTKCLHFRTETLKNNPEGRSVLRNSVLSYLYRKNVQNIEAIGIERDLAGYPIFQIKDPTSAPGQAVPDPWNKNDPKAATLLSTLQQLAREIKRDEQEGMVLPWWVDFRLVSAGGSRRQFDTNAIVLRYDQRIAMAMLADFILLGHEAVGSKGLASTKSALFTTSLAGLLSIITATFNRFGIPQLMRLNGWPLELQPLLVHGDVESIDLADLGIFISNLSRAGMPLFPDADLETALLEAAKLPTAGVIDPATETYGQDTGGLEKRLAVARRLAKSASREARRGRPKGRAQVGARS